MGPIFRGGGSVFLPGFDHDPSPDQDAKKEDGEVSHVL